MSPPDCWQQAQARCGAGGAGGVGGGRGAGMQGRDVIAAQDLVPGEEATHGDGRDDESVPGDRSGSGHKRASGGGGAVVRRRATFSGNVRSG